MAVVEYMLHKQGTHRVTPDFIIDGGNWFDPDKHTLVGWVEDTPEYYVPETLVKLDKQAFLARLAEIQINNVVSNDVSPAMAPTMTPEQTLVAASQWYDDFVARHTGV